MKPLDWFMAIPLVVVFVGAVLSVAWLLYHAYTEGRYGFLAVVVIVVWSCLSWAYFAEVDDKE